MIERINIGLNPNDGTGDSIRIAFDKVNHNFTNLQDRVLDIDGIEVTLSNKANRSEIPSIVGLASESLVNQKIAQAVIGLVNRQELQSGLNAKPDYSDLPSLDGYATQTYVNQRLIAALTDYITTARLAQALANKADRSEIQSIEGLASETWVRQLINDTDADLTDYFTKSEVLAKIAEAQLDGGDVDLSGYATLTFVNSGLNLKANKTELTAKADRTWVTAQINAIPPTDLTAYATRVYVNGQIAAIDYSAFATKTWVISQLNAQTVDLSNYYNKTQVDNLLLNKANKNEIPSLVGYATEAYVNQQISTIPGVDLNGYATETYVSNAIVNKADKSELVDFITVMDLPTKTSELTNDSGYVTAQSLDGYATQSYVMNAIANAELGEGETIDLTIYETITSNDAKLSLKANLTDIPSLNGYATQLYVDNKIALIPAVDLTPYALKTDLSPYATTASVDSKLTNKANISDIPNVSGLASEAWVTLQIENAQIGGGTVDLSNYYKKTETYSKSEVDTRLSSKANSSEIPSIVGLATESYVAQQIANIEPEVVDLTPYATKVYVGEEISKINIPSEINVFANAYGIHNISDVFGASISINTSTEINNKTLVNTSGRYTITSIASDAKAAFNITNIGDDSEIMVNYISGKSIIVNGVLIDQSILIKEQFKPLLFFVFNQYVIIRY